MAFHLPISGQLSVISFATDAEPAGNAHKPISCLLVAVALLTTLITPSLAGEKPSRAKHDGPPGTPCVYKTSAGKERRMEILDEWLKGWTEAHRKWKSLGVESIDYLVAPNEEHGFFNPPDWRTVTLIAADDFLVKHGLLAGKATLTPPRQRPLAGVRL